VKQLSKPLVDYVLSLEGHINIHYIMTESRIKDFYKNSLLTLKNFSILIKDKLIL
jgi:hypothetical protein